jgi:dihydropteroate synthase
MSHDAYKIGDLQVGSQYPVRVMGVLNLSPESFYKGSVVSSTQELVEQVHRME